MIIPCIEIADQPRGFSSIAQHIKIEEGALAQLDARCCNTKLNFILNKNIKYFDGIFQATFFIYSGSPVLNRYRTHGKSENNVCYLIWNTNK